MSNSGAEIYTKLDQLAQSLQGLLERVNRIQSDLDAAKSDISAQAAQTHAIAEELGEIEQAQGEARAKIVSDANESIQKLCLGGSQEEILDIFLQEAEQYVDRAILFLSRDDRYTPWKSIGFEREKVESIVAEGPDDPILRSARRQRIIYKSDSPSEVFTWLTRSGEMPRSAICVPLVFNDYVPLVLYGDSSGSVSLDALELLTHLTVLVLKNNYLQHLAARTAPPEVEAEEEEATAPPEAARESDFLSHMSAAEAAGVGFADVLLDEDVQADLGGTETEPEEPVAESATRVTAPAEVPGEEVSTLPPPDAGGEPEDLQEAEVESFEETPESEPDREATVSAGAPEPTAHAGEEASIPAAEPPESEEVPGAGFEPETEKYPAEDESLWAPLPVEVPEDALRDDHEPSEAPPFEDFSPPSTFEEPELPEPEPVKAEPFVFSEDEQRLHNDARRFARLLVSEIKLYNENQVLEGREKGDLYLRLSRDIDRSREMYEKRAHPSIQTSKDYFHEELIRIVAGGNEQLLGDGYPGPRIQ